MLQKVRAMHLLSLESIFHANFKKAFLKVVPLEVEGGHRKTKTEGKENFDFNGRQYPYGIFLGFQGLHKGRTP